MSPTPRQAPKAHPVPKVCKTIRWQFDGSEWAWADFMPPSEEFDLGPPPLDVARAISLARLFDYAPFGEWETDHETYYRLHFAARRRASR